MEATSLTFDNLKPWIRNKLKLTTHLMESKNMEKKIQSRQKLYCIKKI